MSAGPEIIKGVLASSIKYTIEISEKWRVQILSRLSNYFILSRK